MTDAAALQSHALQVATKAARNIGGTIREVARRTKSQAYLFGQLRRRFPDAPEEAIRSAMHWLRHNAPDAAFVPTDRAPTTGREQSADPVWRARAQQLADLFNVPLEPEAVLLRAATRLRWKRNFTIQTLAAAEDAELIEYVDGHWGLPEPEQDCADHLNQQDSLPILLPACVLPITPEDPMTLIASEAVPTPAAPPAAAPPPDPPETPEERRRRKKREAQRRQRAAGSKPKPRPPTPASPAMPAPMPAAAAATLDALLEARVKELVAAEVGTIIQKLITKALVAA